MGLLIRGGLRHILVSMKAAFPGSFDPPTLGHLDIIRRSAVLFDELTVVIAENRRKTCLFTAEERLELMSALVKPWKNVSVFLSGGLVVDFLNERGIPLLVRGLRGGDFSSEFELSLINKTLAPGIETVFLVTDPRYLAVRSSVVKELASFGGDLSAVAPPEVERALREKGFPAPSAPH